MGRDKSDQFESFAGRQVDRNEEGCVLSGDQTAVDHVEKKEAMRSCENGGEYAVRQNISLSTGYMPGLVGTGTAATISLDALRRGSPRACGRHGRSPTDPRKVWSKQARDLFSANPFRRSVLTGEGATWPSALWMSDERGRCALVLFCTTGTTRVLTKAEVFQRLVSTVGNRDTAQCLLGFRRKRLARARPI